ncbi:MAG TPA: hypothetical protein PLZ84_02065, partial [Clostridia bacterium]|nr:hypothetical protein [Clostridia bacterium]
MFIKEIAASLYPWDLHDEGIENIAGVLQERSLVNSIYLVGVMHYEKRPLTSLFYTHNDKRKYYLPENSRVYYRLDMNSFKNTKLKPLFSEREFLRGTDWLDVLTKEARRRGLKAGIELSHTIFDTDVAMKEFPDTVQKGVNGNPLGGWLCPNNPDVHEYQRAMFYDTVKNHDVDYVQTCLLTFAQGGPAKAPWFFNTWMNVDKATSVGKLFSVARGGCFCEHCRAKAKALGYDWDIILRDMKKLFEIANASPYGFQDSLMEHDLTMGSDITDSLLLIEYPGLMEFLKFRIDSITELFRDFYISVHEAKPDIDFRYNNHTGEPEYQGI